MTDDAGFLQAIIAEPDDDTPRLVYADWLDEHGQSDRAEFIRIQCEMARLDKDDPRYAELDRRERQLRKAHFEEWIGPLRAVTHFYKTRSEFRRGFVEFVHITSDPFPEQATILFGMAPICRAMIEVGAENFLATVQSPCLAQLVELRLAGYAGTFERIRSLGRIPALLKLRRLVLTLSPSPSDYFRGTKSADLTLMAQYNEQWRNLAAELRVAFGDRLELPHHDRPAPNQA